MNGPLVVLQLVNGEYYAGAERVQDDLAIGMEAHGFRTIYVALLNGVFDSRRRYADPPLVTIPMRSRFDVGVAGRIAAHARSAGAVLIHSHMPRTGLVAAVVARRYGIPFVQHVHTSEPSTTLFNHIGSTVAMSLTFRSAAAVIACSAHCVDFAAARGAPRGRLHLIENGVDIRPWSRTPIAAGKTLRIGFAATIRRLKGLSVLIAALDRLPALGVDAEVLVAGDFADPDYEREIRAQVAARPRPDERLRWLGHQRDLAAFRAQCDILVFPSVGDEGRPLVALEAMADGLPIVAAAVPGVTDLVRHDDTGILFAPRDPAALAAAIARVWREPELAERCARNAYAYVSQRHDKRRMIAETCRVYQEVLGAAATATRR